MKEIEMSNLRENMLNKYNKDGFVIVENLFSKKEMAELKSSIGKIISFRFNQKFKNNFSKDKLGTYDKLIKFAPQIMAKLNRKEFDYLTDIIWQTPAFMRMVSKSKIQELVNIFLGRSKTAPLYGYINKCRICVPNDHLSETGWHREIFQTIPRTNFVQIWAPLINNASTVNGAIQICAKSHLADLQKPKWKSNSNNTSKVVYKEKDLQQFRQIDMNLRVGEAVFFSGRVLHRSGKNLSNFSRFSMVGLYHDLEDSNFVPPKSLYSYQGETPKDYFDSLPDFS